MEDILDGEDFQALAEAMLQDQAVSGQIVTFERTEASGTVSLNGKTGGPTLSYHDVQGTLEDVSQVELIVPGGMVSLGDIRFTSTFDVREKRDSNTPGGYQVADVMIYGGFKWYMVGIPFRKVLSGGVLEVKSYWRRS